MSPTQTDQSVALEASRLFRDTRNKTVLDVTLYNGSGATAYLLVFDSFTQATPGSDTFTFGSRQLVLASGEKATWTTGTKCRFGTDTTAHYLALVAGDTYTVHASLADAIAGRNAETVANGTIHVLDWIETPPLAVEAGDTRGLTGLGGFDGGCLALISTSPTTYTSAGATGRFFARYTT